VQRGEGIPRGLIVARSDATELLEFAEEILDQVPCLVERLIKLDAYNICIRTAGGLSR
jgi:hypothetical protein